MRRERVQARIARDRARVLELRARWAHGDEEAGHEADQLELELERLAQTLRAHEAAQQADPGELARAVERKFQERDAERATQAAARETFERRMRGEGKADEAAPEEEGSNGKQLAVGRPGTDPAGDRE